MHHVSWRADAPIMWDCATQTTCRLYCLRADPSLTRIARMADEPVAGSTIPDLEALVQGGGLPKAFEDYVLGFTRPVRETRRAGTREGSFCDLWMPEAEADERRNWAATEAAREAVEATAAARL